MEYYTYWSILDTPSHTLNPYVIFLIIGAVGIIAWLLIKKFKKGEQDIEKLILSWGSGVISIFSIAAFLLKFIYPDKSNEAMAKLMNSSKVQKVEGLISNFSRKIKRARYGNVTTESFNIDSVTFSYTDALLGKFNSFSKTNNGVFRHGLQVRISFIKEESGLAGSRTWILKIEIAKE